MIITPLGMYNTSPNFAKYSLWIFHKCYFLFCCILKWGMFRNFHNRLYSVPTPLNKKCRWMGENLAVWDIKTQLEMQCTNRISYPRKYTYQLNQWKHQMGILVPYLDVLKDSESVPNWTGVHYCFSFPIKSQRLAKNLCQYQSTFTMLAGSV